MLFGETFPAICSENEPILEVLCWILLCPSLHSFCSWTWEGVKCNSKSCTKREAWQYSDRSLIESYLYSLSLCVHNKLIALSVSILVLHIPECRMTSFFDYRQHWPLDLMPGFLHEFFNSLIHWCHDTIDNSKISLGETAENEQGSFQASIGNMSPIIMQITYLLSWSINLFIYMFFFTFSFLSNLWTGFWDAYEAFQQKEHQGFKRKGRVHCIYWQRLW